MTDMREVNANLMFAPGEWMNFEQREGTLLSLESKQNAKLRLRRSATRNDAVLDRDRACGVFAQRRVDQSVASFNRAVNNREILLRHLALLPNSADLSRGLGVLRHEGDAASLAVEAIDQLRLAVRAGVQANAADQAGVFVALGRMAHEARRLVDNQQVGIFGHDVEQFQSARLLVSDT